MSKAMEITQKTFISKFEEMSEELRKTYSGRKLTAFEYFEFLMDGKNVIANGNKAQKYFQSEIDVDEYVGELSKQLENFVKRKDESE